MGKPIDMVAVRESLAALDRIAAEHPELLGKSAPEEWEQTLKSTGLERQKRLISNRLKAGMERLTIWVSSDDMKTLRELFPGPRGGADWKAVIDAAVARKTGQCKPTE